MAEPEPAVAEPVPAPPAAAEPEEAPVPTKVGYEKGFFIEQGENSLGIQARLQARYTHVETDGGHNVDNFSIARARVTFHGNVFMEDLSYKLQIDFGKGNTALKDFYLDYCIADDMLCIRPGQFKRPFSRQQINSSGNLEFVDRSITDKAFGAGRDIGLMLHDNYEKSPTFEYAVGIFNGTGDKSHFSGSGTADLESGDVDVDSGSFSNVPSLWKPALGLRLGYNFGGIKGYSEADFEGGGFRFAIAGSVEAYLDPDNTDDSLVKSEADLVVKIEGLSASGAVYHTSQQDGEGFGDRANGDGGAHFQLGYLIMDKFQPVVRYGIVDPRHLSSNNIDEEFAFGLNYYMKKHNLKWQNDLTALNDHASDTTEWEFRSQAQLSF